MINCIVFDLDDTLYLERDYCRSGFRAVSQWISSRFNGLDAGNVFATLWAEFENGDRSHVFNNALDHLGMKYNHELISSAVEIYRNHFPDITLPDDTKTVLNELKSIYKLALLTDGFLPAQRYKVESLGLSDIFDCTVYTEEIGRQYWKPSDAGFKKILSELHVEGNECVYVADNLTKDFIAPNHLGFMTVQLRRPGRIHPDPDEVPPDGTPHHVINNLYELSGLLKGI